MIPTMLIFMIQQSVDSSALSMQRIYANTVQVMEMESRSKQKGAIIAECTAYQRSLAIRLHEGATKEFHEVKSAAERLDIRIANTHANSLVIAEEKSGEILRVAQSCFESRSSTKQESRAIPPAQLEMQMDIQEDAPDASPS